MTAQLEKPATELIQRRFSCRQYQERPIDAARQQQLTDFIATHQDGPFGSPTRFQLIAATEADRNALQGLGTYGFIKQPAGFIVGALGPGQKNLEDFGYVMEHMILFATDLELGTCWLGGSFTKSRFAKRITAHEGERVPAVTSVGLIPQQAGLRDRFSHRKQREAWETMFFERTFDRPLSRDRAGAYATPLEMVRLGPSASNKQPWRIVRAGATWHLYIQRTPHYGNWFVNHLLGIADMQRLDAGIAMCHLELSAIELGLPGAWVIDEPAIQKPDDRTEYIASWSEG